MTYNQKVGAFGEKLAQEFLVKRGYAILETNIKTSYKEIDIIALKNNVLVFVEVKTRTSMILGSASEAVVPHKTGKLVEAIEIYLEHFKPKFDYNDIRLDLISIDIRRQEKTAKIKHFKSIA